MAAGPYQADQEPRPILGRSLEELEALPLTVLGEFRLRKMVGRDRLYTNGESALVVGVDGDRRVTQVALSVLTPDEDHDDDRFEIEARGPDGAAMPLSYQWACLVHFAHGVLGLGPKDASDLLSRWLQPGTLPMTRGGVTIELVSGQFLGGPERLALACRFAGSAGYTGSLA